MTDQKWTVIFNAQDTSSTIRIERDLGNPALQSIDLTCPGTDWRQVPGLTAEAAIGEAEQLIALGYGTHYRVL